MKIKQLGELHLGQLFAPKERPNELYILESDSGEQSYARCIAIRIADGTWLAVADRMPDSYDPHAEIVQLKIVEA